MSDVRLILKRVSTGVETELHGELTVGRSAESGMLLPQASRRHAVVGVSSDTAWVEDVGSTNGTFVNNSRITARTTLASGDRVRFDLDEFEFRVINPSAIEDRTAPRNPGVVAEKKKTPGSWVVNEGQAGGSKTMLVGSEEMRNKLRAEKAAAPPRAPQRMDGPCLVVSSGSREHDVIPLRPSAGKSEWTIGSDAERDIVLQDSGVSGLHALITNDGSRWQLSDQLSANGTFVNGNRVNMSFLSSGDSIRFGPVQCRFQLPEKGLARLAGGSSSDSRRAGGSSASEQVSRDAGGRGTNLVLIAVISFIVTVLILGFLWWHNR